MRVVFAGTPEFAARALDALLASRHPVFGVLTQPDRPSGRGQKQMPSPVKARALGAGLPVLQPATLRDPTAQYELQALQPDVIIVAAYGLILPQAVLDMAPLGCLNIHASLLPRWRGAAPIVRAIQAGDSQSGVCIMKMDAGLDTGPVAITRTTPIHFTDTAGSLHDRLAELGAQAIVDALDALAGADPGALRFEAQPADGVTYARKLEKSEARVDWRKTAAEVANHLRAFDPQPGACSALVRQPEVALRFFKPSLRAGMAEGDTPGRIEAVTDHGLLITTGSGSLTVGELQRPGGRRLPVADFVRGHGVQAGDLLVPS